MTADRQAERTIHIAGELHTALKLAATAQGTTVKRLATDLLQSGLRRLHAEHPSRFADWTSRNVEITRDRTGRLAAEQQPRKGVSRR